MRTLCDHYSSCSPCWSANSTFCRSGMVFTVFGLLADFMLFFWWACAATISISCCRMLLGGTMLTLFTWGYLGLGRFNALNSQVGAGS
jgi:hypothetical protein